jgi:hypothetical protein
MRTANFVDLRNVYNPKLIAEVGFKYRSLGRPCGMEGGK